MLLHGRIQAGQSATVLRRTGTVDTKNYCIYHNE